MACRILLSRMAAVCCRTLPLACRGSVGVCSTMTSRLSSGTAQGRQKLGLLSCVEEEVELERELVQDLPKFTEFTVTVSGCVATLDKEMEGERVRVELDANHVVEVMSEDIEEEDEPFFVPAFTVTITNYLGSQLQVECSFDENGESMDQVKEWDNLVINSLSVVNNNGTIITPYTISAENLSADVYDSLLSYLDARGINQTFTQELLHFYRVHEHKCYLELGLKELKSFLRDSH